MAEKEWRRKVSMLLMLFCSIRIAVEMHSIGTEVLEFLTFVFLLILLFCFVTCLVKTDTTFMTFKTLTKKLKQDKGIRVNAQYFLINSTINCSFFISLKNE